MKTIEERAIQAADGYEDQAYSAGLYIGYKEGATEQKKIDDDRYIESLSKILKSIKKDTIDAVCEWLSNYFVVKHEGMTAQGCDAFLKEFRKAMEE